MTVRPAVFSPAVVRALIEGLKTQDRRIIKEAPSSSDGRWSCDFVGSAGWQWVGMDGFPTFPCRLRFGVGDRLWVREPWAKPFAGDRGYIFRADGPEYLAGASAVHQWGSGAPWKPSIHMPRQASRLTLTVTDVRVQRLQEISAADTIAEGVQCSTCAAMKRSACTNKGCFASSAAFSQLWDDLKGKGAWDANPWIVALTFTVERRNIDA